MRPAKRVAAAALLALLAGPLHAAVLCSGSNTSMGLGLYDGNQPTPLDSSATFVVTCFRSGGPQNNTITVGLGPSSVSGGIATRQVRLVAGTDVLVYNVYRDAGRTLVWGDTIGSNTLSQNLSIPNNSANSVTFTFFGRINASQDVRAGSYNDSLTITVTF